MCARVQGRDCREGIGTASPLSIHSCTALTAPREEEEYSNTLLYTYCMDLTAPREEGKYSTTLIYTCILYRAYCSKGRGGLQQHPSLYILHNQRSTWVALAGQNLNGRTCKVRARVWNSASSRPVPVPPQTRALALYGYGTYIQPRHAPRSALGSFCLSALLSLVSRMPPATSQFCQIPAHGCDNKMVVCREPTTIGNVSVCVCVCVTVCVCVCACVCVLTAVWALG